MPCCLVGEKQIEANNEKLILPRTYLSCEEQENFIS